MKILVVNDTKCCVYAYEDNQFLDIGTENTVVGSPPKHILTGVNTFNVTLYENVNLPEGWKSYKYLYDGTTWTQNPDWEEPPLPPHLRD